MSDMEIMTVKEVAQYLGLKPVTIYKLANEGKLPAFKVASYWRFTKELIEKWANEEPKGLPGEPELSPSTCPP